MARIEKTVFLSYRRTDLPWALNVYQALTHSGFDVFFDVNAIASGDFESIILESIRARAHFIVVLTPTALERCGEPRDFLRREIEESITCRRNVVPLFFGEFDFKNSKFTAQLTGKLATLKSYSGVRVPDDYFDAAMERLCNKYLNVPLEAVLHPPSIVAQVAAKEQQVAASTDALTGLLNRREFQGHIEHALRRVKEWDGAYALCYLDIDHFKSINDKCGHTAGDRYLVEMSALVKSKIRDQDLFARLGGDEFGILVEGSLEVAMRTAETLSQSIRELSFISGEHTFNLGASIGVVEMSADSRDIETVLSAADSACYEAKKKADRNHVFGFEEKEDIALVQLRREMQWVARTNDALEEGRFELFRQSIVPLQMPETGKHFELLLRMRDQDGELILPGNFIPAAQRYGIMPQIDRWVIENAFQWLVSEADEREKLAMCSINLSGQSLGDDKFLPYVIDQFRRSGLDATKICFEFIETTAVTDISKVSQFIQTLKDLGCKFALDDFGSGLSSFSYLKEFPVDFLKIDGSFVTEILRNPIDREMVRSINEIGHLTGKQTIAEFAENQEIINMLRSLGVDYAQGYGVSHPERVGLPSTVSELSRTEG